MRLAWRSLLLLCLVLSLLGPATLRAGADNGWTAGPSAVGDNTYIGFIDTPATGTTFLPNSMVVVQGWVVDQSAAGWTGIDQVQIYLGLQDQGGTLMVQANLGTRRDDVVSATGNSFWANSGFSGSFSANSLPVGSSTLTVYAHTPDKGWWYRQLQVSIPAAPDRAFADDPLLIVRQAAPSLDVSQQSTPTLILTGYAIDRNLPLNQQLGVGGSGVSRVQAYLDGPRVAGTGPLIATATLGQKNREATGFGDRFLMSGWELTVHPGDMTVDNHALFIYADSAYWPSETLVIVPVRVRI